MNLQFSVVTCLTHESGRGGKRGQGRGRAWSGGGGANRRERGLIVV